MDKLTTRGRSALMARITGDDLGPESRLRAALSAAGLRFDRNCADLPGSPDVAFPEARLAVFVHGCFWHGHRPCYREPKSNRAFWRRKLAANRRRDSRAARGLRAAGWSVLVVRECRLKRGAGPQARRVARALERLNARRRGRRIQQKPTIT